MPYLEIIVLISMVSLKITNFKISLLHQNELAITSTNSLGHPLTCLLNSVRRATALHRLF